MMQPEHKRQEKEGKQLLALFLLDAALRRLALRRRSLTI